MPRPMKNIVLAAALGATILAGAACAQAPAADAPPARHMGMRGMGVGALLRADLNHDGVITRAEAIAEADQRFAAMDANHDGTLTRDERRAAMEARRAARADRTGSDAPPPRGAADGAAPAAGDLGFAQPGGRGMGMRGGRDQTAAEFRDRALRMFDRVDTNHDGRVDRNEIEAARLLMRARMSGGDQAPAAPADDQ